MKNETINVACWSINCFTWNAVFGACSSSVYIWNFVLQRNLWLYDLCWWWYLWMITKFLLCRKIFCMMYYEIEICPMLHCTIKFNQNTCICRTWICRTKLHMTNTKDANPNKNKSAICGQCIKEVLVWKLVLGLGWKTRESKYPHVGPFPQTVTIPYADHFKKTTLNIIPCILQNRGRIKCCLPVQETVANKLQITESVSIVNSIAMHGHPILVKAIKAQMVYLVTRK